MIEHLTRALQRTAAPLGSRTVRIICQQLLQPTWRFRRRSLSLLVSQKPMLLQAQRPKCRIDMFEMNVERTKAIDFLP